MPVIIKSFMGVFFFMLVVFSGIGIVQYQMQIDHANSYKQDMIEELQDSNFSPAVMNACILAGESNDYEVSVNVSSSDGTHTVYTKDHPAVSTADVVAAYVTVNYKSKLPFLGVETANSLRGFAK